MLKYLYLVHIKKKSHHGQSSLFVSKNQPIITNETSNAIFYLKINSLIARLNEEYIGFECMCLLRLTKVALYEFLYYIFSMYIFINDLNH